MATQARQHQGQYVHANGIDIYYVEAGKGEPLLLLDNAMVSTNPIWESLPFAYASFMATLAERFRVIAPDTRGSGKSVHSGGPIRYPLLADDVAALIGELRLDQPLICAAVARKAGSTSSAPCIARQASLRRACGSSPRPEQAEWCGARTPHAPPG
jgi:pimeloyl-ACP methyl ester carboxylesterase